MIARLWWKEMRTLWPAWLILFVAGAGLQRVLLASAPDQFRSGILIPIALCWATLYAFVAASAAFAGEREAGTLRLLEALPVDRKTLWLSKSSFTLVSTFGLGLVMLTLGYADSTEQQWRFPGQTHLFGHFGTLLYEAVAWGLLWSALLQNPMIAGALAVLCVGEVSYIATGGARIEFISETAIPARFGMATLALTASAIAIACKPLAGGRSAWLPRPTLVPLAHDESALPIKPRPASPRQVLMWKAMREGRGTWLFGSLIAWGLASLMISNQPVYLGILVPVLALGAVLVAGVGVFGCETSVGSQRFLLHLGIRPGPIWSGTMRAWGNGLAVTLLGLLALVIGLQAGSLWRAFARPNVFPAFTAYFAVITDAFLVAVLAGMVFPRRITAGLIALIFWVAIASTQFGPMAMGMIPPWSLVLTPVALLLISRAWAGDWLDPRPGAARWIRLCGFVAVPTVLFSAAYVAHRAWGVPDPGPVPVPAAAPPSLSNALITTTYRKLSEEIRTLGGMGMATATTPKLTGEPTPKSAGSEVTHPEHLSLITPNPEFIERIHRAAELPPSPPNVRLNLSETSASTDLIIDDMVRVSWVLDSHGRTLMDRGELAGAWEDVVALYRMSRQMTATGSSLTRMPQALLTERQATLLAIDWAAAEQQQPPLLRKAITDLQALPPFPTIGDVMRAEAPDLERTLDLSTAELVGQLYGPRMWKQPRFDLLAETLLLYSPWERERARRVCRTEIKRLIAEDAKDSNGLPLENQHDRRSQLQQTSPLAATLISYYWFSDALRNVSVGRRGLLQVIALRAWNLTHDGAYPLSLDALVPDLLDHLPNDPYSGRPFGYVKSQGTKVVKLNLQSVDRSQLTDVKPGQWLLFSVGPDGQAGYPAVSGTTLPDDMVFPLP